MKISFNWLQEYLNFKLPAVDELVEVIGSQLGAVEAVEDLGAKYRGVVAVKIVECSAVENSDHLNLCLIDDGQMTAEVERNVDGYVQVVCGAPNARVGLTVAWLPPGSTVPSTVGHEPFVLGSRALRGHVSNGMLASQKELALGDNHAGILEIDVECAAGADFAKLYKLNDYVIDIENKMFTHRPDCFGVIGIAREVAGILNQPFTEPDWYLTLNNDLAVDVRSLSLVVRNDTPELVPRFIAVAISGVAVKSSPVYIQTLLQRVGIRSINNIVDTTNYFMHLTGQPLHAYDYDKVKALDDDGSATLIARQVRSGEKLMLLTGKEIEPRDGAIVIATNNCVIGLAGVMGGASTEVDGTTQNIILESATFDMYSIRRTSMVHGLFSDAVTRFNKGQSPYQNDRVILQAAKMICQAGAHIASEIEDKSSSTLTFDQAFVGKVTVEISFINSRLGGFMTTDDVVNLLGNVGFRIVSLGKNNDILDISVPFWRTDITIAEDIVEEVGRLYGFDKLELKLPTRAIAPAIENDVLNMKSNIRTILSRAGANEVLTYSFIHGKLLDKASQDRATSYKLTNALSPDLQYYRQTLTPSLLDKVSANIRNGFDQFVIFEIGKTHILESESDSDELPHEYERLSLVFAADSKAAKQYQGAAFYQAKSYLADLLKNLGVTTELTFEADETSPAIYDKNRQAVAKLHGTVIGFVGEFSASIRKALKLPEYSSGFEIDISAILKLQNKTSAYQALPKFPKSSQDICLRVPVATPYADVWAIANTDLANKYGSTAVYTVSPIDIFQRDKDDDYKQITLRISLNSYLKTLTDDEVAVALGRITQVASEKLGAERI